MQVVGIVLCASDGQVIDLWQSAVSAVWLAVGAAEV
jgi:hypothetical protein